MKTKAYFYLFVMLFIYTFSSCNNDDEPMSSDPTQSNSIIINETNSGTIIKEVLKSTMHNGTIYGKVRDNDTREPLPGVFVRVKGAVTGVTTDDDGNYSISVPDSGILVFSFPGYITTEVEFNINTGSIILYMKSNGI
jgi:hypothetical protein